MARGPHELSVRPWIRNCALEISAHQCRPPVPISARPPVP
ncbi:unnamed protein product, partial [Staurois parvus]